MSEQNYCYYLNSIQILYFQLVIRILYLLIESVFQKVVNEEGEEELRLQTQEQSGGEEAIEEYETGEQTELEETEVEPVTEETNLSNIQVNINLEDVPEIPKISRIFFNKDGITVDPNTGLSIVSPYISKALSLCCIFLHRIFVISY